MTTKKTAANSTSAGKPKRSFASIDAARKRYDPETEGFGGPEQWNHAFYERMGVEEAEHVLYGNSQTPRSILGVGNDATWKQILSAFRKRALEVHPDRIALTGLTYEVANEKFKTVSAAFAVLAREFGK